MASNPRPTHNICKQITACGKAAPFTPKKEMTSLVQIPKPVMTTTMIETTAPTVTQALRIARSGLLAPMFWPTIVRTAPWRENPGILPILLIRLPRPHAARAKAPNGASIHTNTKLAPLSKNICPQAGHPNCNIRFISIGRGARCLHLRCILAFPLKRMSNMTTEPVSLPTPKPRYTPDRCNGGIGPNPKIRGIIKNT